MKYKATIYLIFIFFCNGCRSQLKINKMDIKKFGELLIKEVKRYPYEPTYYFSLYSNACSFQVLINDMPIWSFFKMGGMSGTMLPINAMVSKSGEQTVTIKVYPPNGVNDELTKVIGSNAQMQIALAVTDWQNKMPMKVINKILFLLPIVNGKLSCAGLPYFEYTVTFDLQVPYETISWNNGVNLAKEDSSRLQKEVLYVYEKVWKMWSEKDLIKICNYTKSVYISGVQSQYRDMRIWKEYSDDLLKIINNKNFKMEPIEKYTLKYYGNGKVVALERIDLWNRNRSALLKYYIKDNGSERTETEPLYLYRPSKNSPLEPIR